MSDPETPGAEALAEAQPDSLSELMSRAPATLSDDDKRRIITAMREQRERWLAEEAAGVRNKSKAAKVSGAETTKTPKRASTKVAIPVGFSLKDIGL